jgi:hypothetical protein
MKRCPFCKRQLKDLLKHLVLVHEIRDSDQFERELERVSGEENEKTRFFAFVSVLNEQKRKGLISAQEYRTRMRKWREDQVKSHDAAD